MAPGQFDSLGNTICSKIQCMHLQVLIVLWRMTKSDCVPKQITSNSATTFVITLCCSKRNAGSELYLGCLNIYAWWSWPLKLNWDSLFEITCFQLVIIQHALEQQKFSRHWLRCGVNNKYVNGHQFLISPSTIIYKWFLWH